MPFRRAMRWFSEACGVALGVGLLWCHLRLKLLEDRIYWLETIKPKTVIQNNNQQVIVEDTRTQLIKELATKDGWKTDGKAEFQQGESSRVSGTRESNMPTDSGSVGSTSER